MLGSKLLYGAGAGTFSFLPHMARALEKLTAVIDQEMQAIGAQKIVLPNLAPGQIWKATGKFNHINAVSHYTRPHGYMQSDVSYHG